MQQVRERVERIDPAVPIADIRTMDAIVRQATARERFSMTLMTFFAASAILLAALGVYGVLSFSVGQRRREIAVRMAVGSSPEEVSTMVVREGVRLAMMGAALGLGGSLAFGRLIQSLLFSVSGTDATSFLFALALAMGAALFAAWLPARRAVRVDPTEALRAD